MSPEVPHLDPPSCRRRDWVSTLRRRRTTLPRRRSRRFRCLRRPLLHHQLVRLVRRCLIVPRRRRCRSAQRRPRFQDFPRCRRSLLGCSRRRRHSVERCGRCTRGGTREQRQYRTRGSLAKPVVGVAPPIACMWPSPAECTRPSAEQGISINGATLIPNAVSTQYHSPRAFTSFTSTSVAPSGDGRRLPFPRAQILQRR
jgi:hypothetical protein